MRIAFVTDTYEDSISGGVITGVRFVEALRRRHHAVTVVSTGVPAPGKVLIPGFQVPVRAMRENRFTFGWPSRDTLERVFAAVDIVHINFPFPLGFGALRIARQMGVPTVAAFHVQPENLLRSVGIRSPRLASCLYRFWVRSFFQRADGVVGPSRFAVERLRQYGLTARAWVVSNGAPPCPVRPQSDARFWQPPHPVLCVGRLAAEKRQDVIIDAVARCRHRDRIRLVMAGAGPLERQLHARARQRGLDVEIGWVSDQRLAELRAEAHLFVHASEVELEGMAVLEAMAAGLPVLIADAPDSAAPGLASGPEFLFRPGDASDLAQHLDMLFDAPALLAAAARRSLRRATQYTFDHSVQRLEHVYETLLARAVVSPASLAVSGASARGAA
jgi:glycosyltransferase involved in cell wall biosynthesis